MLKRLGSVKKLANKKFAKKVKEIKTVDRERSCLLSDHHHEEGGSHSIKTPTGYFALYVGEEKRRFLIPTKYLSHPLLKMLLEKAYDEFGFEQRSGLVVPCSVNAFEDVINAVECCNGKFDFGDAVEEFV